MVPNNLIENFKLSNWILELIRKIKLIKNKENFKTPFDHVFVKFIFKNKFKKIRLHKLIFSFCF